MPCQTGRGQCMTKVFNLLLFIIFEEKGGGWGYWKSCINDLFPLYIYKYTYKFLSGRDSFYDLKGKNSTVFKIFKIRRFLCCTGRCRKINLFKFLKSNLKKEFLFWAICRSETGGFYTYESLSSVQPYHFQAELILCDGTFSYDDFDLLGRLLFISWR